ncbi:AAA family ATPase [Desulfovibrio inopinatus]|uniref:AAA family ATPase n=1 Tax=Desulfovibrio inopinatus TaxID=102109 RepID=UPI0004251CCE|nr:MoxR family ATPase [Desulfovibrio inopinatus]
MQPSAIEKALGVLLELRQPTFLWGPPGVGKSQVVAQVAARKGLDLVDIRAVLLDPVDLRGVPAFNEAGETVWRPPSFLPKRGQGVLFLDELNTAPPLVQAACYQLILDRRLGEYILPDGWTVIAAGNRESDRAVTHRMPSALANRMVHLDVEPDIDDWLVWAKHNGVDPRIRAFLRFRPKLLHAFDPKANAKAFPTPRSWAFVSHIVSVPSDVNILSALISGAVGQGAAAECMEFLRICDSMPTPNEVMANPETVPLPDDPAVVLALCEAVSREASCATMPDIARFASRLPVEFSVLLMREAAFVEPDIVETEAFKGWACANSDVLV